MELTWIGLAAFFAVTAVLLPASARKAVRVGHATALAQLEAAVGDAVDAFAIAAAAAAGEPGAVHVSEDVGEASAVVAATESEDALPNAGGESTPAAAAAEAADAAAVATPRIRRSSASPPLVALSRAHSALNAVAVFVSGAPSLMDEAAHEPQLWRRPFTTVRARYAELAAAVARAAGATRAVHDAALELLALPAAAPPASAQRDSARPSPAQQQPVSVLVGHACSLAARIRAVLRHAAASLARPRTGAGLRRQLRAASCCGAAGPGAAAASLKDAETSAAELALLDADVGALALGMRAFAADYDAFLHTVVAAATAAAEGVKPGSDAPPEAQRDSPTTLGGPPLERRRPPAVLPNEVALGLYAFAFALRELSAATLDVLRSTR